MFWGLRGFKMCLCAKDVHRLTDIRLKPGEGPIRVRLVEVKKKN